MQRYPDNRSVGYQGMYPYQIPANPYTDQVQQNRQPALKIDNFANDILTDEDIDAAISAAEEG